MAEFVHRKSAARKIWHMVFMISCLFFLLMLLMTRSRISSLAAEVNENRITAAGAIVIDFETGRELYSRNADVFRAPASMTKMMTVYLVYQAIEDGKIGLDTIVPISSHVVWLSGNDVVSNIPLSQSVVYTVDELLDIIIIASASGAADALAELVGGTVEAFCQMMNDQAERWGIDALYATTYGGGESTQLTPRAMATLVRNTVALYPQVLEKTAMPLITFKGQTYRNTNRLLGEYDGIDGFKTGTSPTAGENFSATAQRGDIRIISVTMGSAYDRRFDDTEMLLDYGFAEMEEYRRVEAENAESSDSRTIVDSDDLKTPELEQIGEEVNGVYINSPAEAPVDPDSINYIDTPVFTDVPESEAITQEETANETSIPHLFLLLSIITAILAVGVAVMLYKEKNRSKSRIIKR